MNETAPPQKKGRLGVLAAMVMSVLATLCAPTPILGDRSVVGVVFDVLAHGDSDGNLSAAAETIQETLGRVTAFDREHRLPGMAPGLAASITTLTVLVAVLYWVTRLLDTAPNGPTWVERTLGAAFPLCLAGQMWVSPATALALGLVYLLFTLWVGPSVKVIVVAFVRR